MKICCLVTGILLLVLLTAGCVYDGASGSPGTEYSAYTPASTIARPPSLFVNASPVKPSYMPGETIEVEITFGNRGEGPVVIDSFPPEISLNNPTSGIVRSFPGGSDTITLGPGESTGYIVKWDQRDFDGNRADPGIYFVEVSNVSHYENGDKRVSYSEGIDIARVIVEYPQGALEGEMFVNRSEKPDGYTVNLENITFTSTVSKAYVVFYSGDGSFFGATKPSGGPVPSPTPPPDLNPSGHYRIDDGPEKEFIRLGYRTGDESVTLVWDFEPVPADAGDLHFVINRLGGWEGYCGINVGINASAINPLPGTENPVTDTSLHIAPSPGDTFFYYFGSEDDPADYTGFCPPSYVPAGYSPYVLNMCTVRNESEPGDRRTTVCEILRYGLNIAPHASWTPGTAFLEVSWTGYGFDPYENEKSEITGEEPELVDVGGYEGRLYDNGDLRLLVWTAGDATYRVYGALSSGELLKVGRSIDC